MNFNGVFVRLIKARPAKRKNNIGARSLLSGINDPAPYMKLTISAVLLVFLVQCQLKPQCAQKNQHEDYLSAIQCPTDFTFLMGMPLSNQYAQVDAVKLVYDLKTNALYFINNRKYSFHYEFCAQYLSYPGDLGEFNTVEYGLRGNRRYLLANLNYYRSSDVYTLEFFSDDRIKAVQISRLFDDVSRSVYFKDKLFLVSNGNAATQLAGIDATHVISVDHLFGKQQYQPMVLERSYGYLQKVGKNDFDTHNFSSHDIILTDFLPNDLPYCQGILTTAFQTPLAHINILSHNRKTPNCAYKPAWDDKNIQKLVGKLVCYEVLPDTFYLKEATLSLAQIFWERNHNMPMRKLSCNLRETALLDVQKINRKSISIVGAKAANFGELEKIKLPDHTKIPVPEAAFAIPFYYYQQHISQNGLQSKIDEILYSDSISNDRTLLYKHLKALQDDIVAAPLNRDLLQRLTDKLKSYPDYTEFRFRSSTNAEDIPGFTGAGLYDSKTGSLTRPDKSIEKAVKKVWASLWTPRAFEERMHAHIDQSNLAMGILVHRAFGTEEANGVAITRNLYRDAYPAITVNIQKGENSVVLPESQATAEQFLLKYSWPINGSDGFAVDYISHSSLNDFQPLLTTDELKLLASYLYAIKKHFYYAGGSVVLGSEFFDFAMDIEFKLDKGSRKIYVKQARPY